MWLNRLSQLTKYMLRSPVVATGLAFLIGFVPGFNIFGIVIAALVTLCRSAIEGLLVTIATTASCCLTSYYTAGAYQTKALTIALLGILVIVNLLTWFFANMLQRGSKWNSILQFAAILGIFIVSVVHLYPSIIDWWAKEIQVSFAQFQA